jgi:HEAT repeat protein
LAAARTDPSIAVRCRLGQLLEGFSSGATAKVIDALLEDAAPSVRGSAFVTLLAFTDAESLRRFSQSWQKAAPETVHAVQTESRTHMVTRKLTGLLASGGDSAMRELAVMAIAALAAEGYEQLLLPVLRDPRSGVRLAAARALASSPLKEVQQQVGELAGDPEFAVREAVREALSRFGP